MLAAFNGHTSTVQLLFSHGARLESKNVSGKTALDLARKQRRSAVVSHTHALSYLKCMRTCTPTERVHCVCVCVRVCVLQVKLLDAAQKGKPTPELVVSGSGRIGVRTLRKLGGSSSSRAVSGSTSTSFGPATCARGLGSGGGGGGSSVGGGVGGDCRTLSTDQLLAEEPLSRKRECIGGLLMLLACVASCAGAALMPLGLIQIEAAARFNASRDFAPLGGGCTVLAARVLHSEQQGSACIDYYSYDFTTSLSSSPWWRPRWRPYQSELLAGAQSRGGGSVCAGYAAEAATDAVSTLRAPAAYAVGQNVTCWQPSGGEWSFRALELAAHYACTLQPDARSKGRCGVQLFDPSAKTAAALASAQSFLEIGYVLLGLGLPLFALFACCLNRLCRCLFPRPGRIYAIEPEGRARVPHSPSMLEEGVFRVPNPPESGGVKVIPAPPRVPDRHD